MEKGTDAAEHAKAFAMVLRMVIDNESVVLKAGIRHRSNTAYVSQVPLLLQLFTVQAVHRVDEDVGVTG